MPDNKDLRNDIIHASHEPSHPGARATLRMVRRRWWWRGMAVDVDKVVKGCATCAAVKPGNWPTTGGSSPLPVSERVWSDVELDFLPKLPEVKGYSRICTAVCRRSKEVILVACNDSDTAETFAALFLDRVVAYKGTPSVLRTDRDPLFVSRTWAELMDELRIEHKFSLAHYHQQHGQV